MVFDKNLSRKVLLSGPHEYQAEKIADKAKQAAFYRQGLSMRPLRHRPHFETEGPDWRAIAAWLKEGNRMPNQVTFDMAWGEAIDLIVELHPQSARQDRNWSTEYSWVDRWITGRRPGSILMAKIPFKNDWELNLSGPREWPPPPFPGAVSISPEESPCENDHELAYFIWDFTASFVMNIFYPAGKESASQDSEIPHFSEVQQALWSDLRHHVKSLKQEWILLYSEDAERYEWILRSITELLHKIPESESLYKEFMVEPDRPDEQWTTPSF